MVFSAEDQKYTQGSDFKGSNNQEVGHFSITGWNNEDEVSCYN
jgi:hypothetical protein